MSKRSNSNRDAVVMVGQVNGSTVQVLQVDEMDPILYEWRVIHADASVHHPHNLYDTMDAAMDAAVQYLIPDDEMPHVTEPTKEDYAALNAALYVGGAQEDIKDLGTAVGTFIAMGQGVQMLKGNLEPLRSDIADLEDYLASSYGGNADHIARLAKMMELFEAQTEVLVMVLERSREIIAAFVGEFVE